MEKQVSRLTETKTTETEQLRRRSLEFIADPERWPAWPVLPLKHHDGDGNVEAGFCITPDFPTVVLKEFPTARGILLQLACEGDRGLPVPGGGKQLGDDEARALYEGYVYARYADVDAMLDAGWMVD
jgi:hypothetical protein